MHNNAAIMEVSKIDSISYADMDVGIKCNCEKCEWEGDVLELLQTTEAKNIKRTKLINDMLDDN